MKNKKYHIEYNGKSFDTDYFVEISDNEFKEIREEHYRKPDFYFVDRQFCDVDFGGTHHNFIDRYYIYDLMENTQKIHDKWSIKDVYNSKELLGYVCARIELNDNVYLPNTTIKNKVHNIETQLRIGGMGVASKVSNFPLGIANEVLQRYNINGNYYDFSCGWGVRLLSSMHNRINYFGTDPNYELCKRLRTMSSDYKDACTCFSDVNIYCQGSEEFIPELENKIGVAFSSPPYFSLEDYKIGNQSYHDGVKYDDWKDGYLQNTIKNIYRYLIDDGRFIINIKNFENYDLVNDTYKIAIENGFDLDAIHVLKNITRVSGYTDFDGATFIDNDEQIYVFKKSSNNNKLLNINDITTTPITKSLEFKNLFL